MRRSWRIGAGLAAAGVGLAAAALWRSDIPYPTLRARYADPRSRFLSLADGVLLHYRDVGRRTGPVLLCLHGYSASGQDWMDWAEELAGEARLLLVDLPGHGLTEAPSAPPQGIGTLADCVDALVEHLGLRKVVLVGSSMGGQVALAYALAHPAKVAGLVLVASIGAAEPAPSGPPPLVFRLLASRLGRWALRHLDLTPMVRRGLAHAYVEPALVTEDTVRRTADFARAPGHRSILTELQLGGRDGALVARLPTLSQPALVMIGDADPLVPVAQAQAIAEALPAARLIVYPGVGHVPMQQIPAQTAEDVRAWLPETVPAKPSPAPEPAKPPKAAPKRPRLKKTPKA